MTLPQLSPDFDRTTGLGASEVGAALGLSKFMSPYALWARKTGRVTDDPEVSARMEWGLRLQDPILQAYADHEGLTFGTQVRRNSVTRRAKAWERLFATTDGFRLEPSPLTQPDPGGLRRIGCIDAKAPGSDDGWGPDGSTEVPPDYYAQAQAQCLVYDLPWCDLAVLFHGSDFRVYRIMANPEDQDAMLTALQEWWVTYIEGDTEPPIVAPPLASTDRVLRRFAGGEGELLATPETEALVQGLVLAWRNRKATQDAYDLARQQVEALMADYDHLATGAGSVTWNRSKDATVTNWEALASAYRLVIAAIQRSTGFSINDPQVDLGDLGVDLSSYASLDAFLDTLQSLNTTTKPGARRFLVKPPSTEE